MVKRRSISSINLSEEDSSLSMGSDPKKSAAGGVSAIYRGALKLIRRSAFAVKVFAMDGRALDKLAEGEAETWKLERMARRLKSVSKTFRPDKQMDALNALATVAGLGGKHNGLRQGANDASVLRNVVDAWGNLAARKEIGATILQKIILDSSDITAHPKIDPNQVASVLTTIARRPQAHATELWCVAREFKKLASNINGNVLALGLETIVGRRDSDVKTLEMVARIAESVRRDAAEAQVPPKVDLNRVAFLLIGISKHEKADASVRFHAAREFTKLAPEIDLGVLVLGLKAIVEGTDTAESRESAERVVAPRKISRSASKSTDNGDAYLSCGNYAETLDLVALMAKNALSSKVTVQQTNDAQISLSFQRLDHPQKIRVTLNNEEPKQFQEGDLRSEKLDPEVQASFDIAAKVLSRQDAAIALVLRDVVSRQSPNTQGFSDAVDGLRFISEGTNLEAARLASSELPDVMVVGVDPLDSGPVKSGQSPSLSWKSALPDVPEITARSRDQSLPEFNNILKPPKSPCSKILAALNASSGPGGRQRNRLQKRSLDR